MVKRTPGHGRRSWTERDPGRRPGSVAIRGRSWRQLRRSGCDMGRQVSEAGTRGSPPPKNLGGTHGEIGGVGESIDAILSNTENTEAFLKRRKVQRDFIFKYLTEDEGVVIPKNINKDQLVKKALDVWTIEKVSPQAYEDVSFSALTRAAGSQIGMRFPTAHVPPQPVYSKPHDTSQATYSAGFDHLALARQFCQWFFQLLNSLNPPLRQPPQEWGPQHFWEDVRLRLLSSAGEQYTEEYEGAAMTSLRLLALARDERLLLSPNLEPGGLKALSSPHGLVLVAVAGTIHRDRECVGIYEQAFGLIRSPLDQNKWKIKFMVLKVRGQEALRVGENLLSPILTWDSNDLQLLCR
uniref:uncharacterized protein C3orf38 homolog n=1 Tax=Oncorhynchus gorbuscha TaxID=8017 RepID=UPI001EAF34E4|nr:uncharacterized protein C3orf38 homolog [Oncorhynchus gorbuscha]